MVYTTAILAHGCDRKYYSLTLFNLHH